ncbi:MAG: ester cyclase [Acidobacteria bacterium]|nr:ester cyclase [Acidobacteriota bacterium]
MTREEIDRQLSLQKEAFARRDPDALTALHVPDGTFESPAYGVVKGRPAIREVYQYWYTAFPDLMLTWETALIDSPRASYLWLFTGTTSGPFFGETKAGSKITLTGATESRYGPEGIIAIRHVFDFSGTLMRTGVLKVKPS